VQTHSKNFDLSKIRAKPVKIGAKSRKFRAQMFRQLYSICVVTGEIRLNGLFFSKKASKKCDL